MKAGLVSGLAWGTLAAGVALSVLSVAAPPPAPFRPEEAPGPVVALPPLPAAPAETPPPAAEPPVAALAPAPDPTPETPPPPPVAEAPAPVAPPAGPGPQVVADSVPLVPQAPPKPVPALAEPAPPVVAVAPPAAPPAAAPPPEAPAQVAAPAGAGPGVVAEAPGLSPAAPAAQAPARLPAPQAPAAALPPRPETVAAAPAADLPVVIAAPIGTGPEVAAQPAPLVPGAAAPLAPPRSPGTDSVVARADAAPAVPGAAARPDALPSVPPPAPPVAAPEAVAEAAVPPAPGVLSRPEPLRPAPGFSGSQAVITGRLPRIADGAAAAATAPGAGQEADLPPLRRHARAFENPAGRPPLAIVLIDTGEPDLDRRSLAALPFPVTFALDPQRPGAELAASIYREAGQEVAILVAPLPQGALAADVEVNLAALEAALPEAVAVMDAEAGGFQDNRVLAGQVVAAVKAQGRGLLSWDRGLNAAAQVARREGLEAATVLRRIDAEGEGSAIMRRYLDRAAFKAAQDGRVVMAGTTRPKTVAAILEWTVEGRASSIALAPLSAVMAP